VYFKQNLCQKGDKCKFSHDLNVERKSEKRNIYEDVREQDTMENWDEEKLEDVVNKKHGEDNVKKNQTAIVSHLKFLCPNLKPNLMIEIIRFYFKVIIKIGIIFFLPRKSVV
jgi:hypothetical protein